MMLRRVLLCLALLFGGPAAAQTACDGSTLPNGPNWGADGPYQATITAYADPASTGQQVQVFTPTGAPGKRPVIFFAHGYGPGIWQAYGDLISHLVSIGYAVVYGPYQQTGVTTPQRYDELWGGFLAAAQQSSSLDLTRVGFLGHSFGGGATPYLAYQGLVQQGWGSEGAFMMLLAPWYSYETPDSLLQALPASLIRGEQIYDQDSTNDHRMAIDIFQHLQTGAGKYFLLGHSGSLNGCTMTADHSTPGQNDSLLLKRLVVFRPLDAMASLAFDHSAAAQRALLQMSAPGGGPVGYLPLSLLPAPQPDQPQSYYQNPWDSPANPREGEESW